MTDLAKRAIACKGWRWMPGMRIINAGIVVAVGVDGRPYRIGLMVGTGEKPLAAREQLHDIVCGCLRSSTTTRRSNESLPDLDDPATLGCLLHLVREAYDLSYGPQPRLRLVGLRSTCHEESEGGASWVFGTLIDGQIQEAYCGDADFQDRRWVPWAHSEAEALVAALEAAP